VASNSPNKPSNHSLTTNLSGASPRSVSREVGSKYDKIAKILKFSIFFFSETEVKNMGGVPGQQEGRELHEDPTGVPVPP